MAGENKGRITQVIGAVLDVRFDEGKLPEINDAIRIPTRDGGELVVEVSQHLGDDTVRCTAQETENGVLLLPPAGQTDTGTQVPAFHGITVDMSSCSDQAITLAAIAPFADSPTCITGIGHIRFQESDRIHAICTELTRMGIHCEETQDSITIYPGMPHPCTVATYDDHRMAMGFALTGLRAEGIVIDDPGCCRKTFENYFEVLDQVIAKIIEM